MSHVITGKMYEQCGVIQAESGLFRLAQNHDEQFGGETPRDVVLPAAVANDLDGTIAFEASWRPGDGTGIGTTSYIVRQASWPVQTGYSRALEMGVPPKLYGQLKGKLLVWLQQEYRIEPEQPQMTVRRQMRFGHLARKSELTGRPIYSVDMTAPYESSLNDRNQCREHLGDVACAAHIEAVFWREQQAIWDAERVSELLDSGYGGQPSWISLLV